MEIETAPDCFLATSCRSTGKKTPVQSNTNSDLTLGVSRGLAGALQTWLLALLHTRVTGHEPTLA